VIISPKKRDRTKYPVGAFNIRRPNGPVDGTPGTVTSAIEQGGSEDNVEVADKALSYSDYLEYIQSGAIGFFKLHGDIFVVQGWDRNRKAAKVC
jgi:hypothetical protein